MEFWLSSLFVPTEQLLDVAVAAERLGYSGMAVCDHVAIPRHYKSEHPSGGKTPFEYDACFPDALTSIAAMGAVTSTLKFMTYVYVAPMRDPFSVAKQAGTIATLTNGRFSLGVGAGWLREEIELLGFDSTTRGRRLDEMLSIIRLCLHDGTVSYRGEFFNFGVTGVYPKPPDHVPIWIGGKSEAALTRAARHDGWVGMDYPLEEIEQTLAVLRSARMRYEDGVGIALPSFEVIVIPLEGHSEGAYSRLMNMGVTGTVCAPWLLGDPRYANLQEKIDSMATFASRFI